MKTSESVALIAGLSAAYPRQTITPESVKVYARMLEDLDPKLAGDAVRHWIATSPYFPTIADIRGLVAERATGLPSPEEAWLEVADNVRRVDSSNNETWWPEWSCREVSAAVRALGGIVTLHDSSNPSTDRAHFMRLYESVRKKAVVTANLEPLELTTAVRGELTATTT